MAEGLSERLGRPVRSREASHYYCRGTLPLQSFFIGKVVNAMKKEQLINNGIFYKTAKDITFSQVPMPQEQLDAFQRTTMRSAKRLRYLRAVFLIGGFGTLAYCFIRYLAPPISYVCAVLSAAIMVLGLSAVASTAKAENRLLEIYNSPRRTQRAQDSRY